jgi:NTE family protein
MRCPSAASDRIAKAHDGQLFHGKTLQGTPDEPRFLINATNMQSNRQQKSVFPYPRSGV